MIHSSQDEIQTGFSLNTSLEYHYYTDLFSVYFKNISQMSVCVCCLNLKRLSITLPTQVCVFPIHMQYETISLLLISISDWSIHIRADQNVPELIFWDRIRD